MDSKLLYSFALGYYEGRVLHEQKSVLKKDLEKIIYLSGYEHGSNDFKRFDADDK